MSRKNEVKDLIDLFFSDTTIGIMKGYYGPYWHQNEFIPYVQSMGADNENYKRLASGIRKAPESWDTTICVAVLAYDEKYSRLVSEENKKDFKYLKKIRNDFAHSNVRDGDITEYEYEQYVQKVRTVANTLIDRCDYSSAVRSKLKLAARRTASSSTGYGSAGSTSYGNTGGNSYRSSGNASYTNTGYSSYKSASNASYGNTSSSSYRNTGGSSYSSTSSSSYKGTSSTSYGKASAYSSGSTGAYAYNNSNTKNAAESTPEKQIVINEAEMKLYSRVRDNMYVGLSLVTLVLTLVVHLCFAFHYESIITYFAGRTDLFEEMCFISIAFFAIIGWRGAVQRYVENNRVLSKPLRGTGKFLFNCLIEGLMRSTIQGAVYIGALLIIIYGCHEKLEIELPISVNVLLICYAILISFVRCYGKIIKRIFGR